uniref:HDC07559 n=1 Tax=Drosophila melanogaster TaxID=7227 RepID=Q6IM36_DROME|nr:TPA_inf: HDC07559 [Drosophila melanogaster]
MCQKGHKVSWIRKRDLHILTAGGTTYTSDQRFQVLRPDGSANWTLQIKYPQPRDSGVYECQINTEPKMSLSYTFNVVVVARAIPIDFNPQNLCPSRQEMCNSLCYLITIINDSHTELDNQNFDHYPALQSGPIETVGEGKRRLARNW